ncbi:MAG: hypothetical protein ACK5JR_05590 [Tropicimonas sp.]|uniref:hypothetical protein n=1 Tax=Tropicimonas sp. TaxID=2067044 RepID=UPI003A845EE5
MGKFAILQHDEQVRLNPDNLESLYADLGHAGAEAIVCRAMEELALRLADLARLHDAGHLARLARVARSMVAISEQVGLASFARVSGDVALCAQTGDPVALAATLRRLERIGDRSLTAIWDLKDPGG